jgi:hypothetical protein
MRLDGLDADPQILRYLRVPPPFGRQAGNAPLCLAKDRRVCRSTSKSHSSMIGAARSR